LPYLLVEAVVIALVLLWPAMVWHSHPAALSNATDSPRLSEEAVQKLFDAQRPQTEKDASP
jgi:hypothetical protein